MLGENLYKLRKKYNLSQESLAEAIDVTRQTISNWELGETSPNPEQLKKLSKVLKISVDELIGNNTESIIIEKVSNTEKLAGLIIKILKFIGIAFIVWVIINILAIILFSVVKTNGVTFKSKSVSINCIKGNEKYIIEVDTNKNYNCNNCSKEMNNDIKNILDYENLDISIRNITNYFENLNGSCE